MKSFASLVVLFAFSLTLAPKTQALPVIPKSVIVPPNDDADESSRIYEEFRKAEAENAPTYEEFLQWATPEEIAEDLGIDPNENLVEEVADKDYNVRIIVDLSSQTMQMFGPGVPGGMITGPVATARPGFRTPVGCHAPTVLDRKHWSRKYDAPMNNSVFFVGGVALHEGSIHQRSHGCVHLQRATSAFVYETVKANRNSTLICVQP